MVDTDQSDQNYNILSNDLKYNPISRVPTDVYRCTDGLAKQVMYEYDLILFSDQL